MRHRPLTQYQYLFLVSTETDTSPLVTSPMLGRGSFAPSIFLFRFFGGVGEGSGYEVNKPSFNNNNNNTTQMRSS